jgi:hypothetical protein
MAPTAVPEGDQVGFVWINAEAAAGHPIDDNVEVGGHKVGRSGVIMGNGNQGAVVDIELGTTVRPSFCQTKEGGRVDGGEDGRKR